MYNPDGRDGQPAEFEIKFTFGVYPLQQYLIDIGAGRLKALSIAWQALATLGYKFNDRYTVRAGYRHLDVDFESDGFIYDVGMGGPILGVTISF